MGIKVDNLDDIKDECKVYAKSATVWIRQTKNHKDQQYYMRLRQLYQKHIPVKVGSIIVDYKIVLTLFKKIKRLKVEVEITKSALIIRYRDPKADDKSGGSFTLNDLSDYYMGFDHIPTAVIEVGA